MSKATLVEQIKGDLLKLVRTAEVFAELAEDATVRGADHLEFLANVLSAEVDATRARRLSARLASWTGRPSSTSRDRHGACANTRPSPSPSPT